MSVQIPYFWYLYHTSGGPRKVAIRRSFFSKSHPWLWFQFLLQKLGSIWSKKYPRFLGWCGSLIRTNQVDYYEKIYDLGFQTQVRIPATTGIKNLNLPLWGGKTSVGLFYHQNPNYSLQSYLPAGISASSCLNKRQVCNALLHPDV